MSDTRPEYPAEAIFLEHGGQLRMSEAIRLGISRYMLYSLRDKGIIEQVSRGIYRWAELPAISDPDLVTVSLRYPRAVICLVSALAHHSITTQIPHAVSIAITRDARIPRLDYPPIRVYRFAQQAFEAGVEEKVIDGAKVNVYSAEKTLADVFKFRNKLGLDVFLEALKLYASRKSADLGGVLRYARICRVDRLIRPYLEAIV
ncbi:MAG: type IV toxin-antitoxin system AbiEi family antitoxin domain-containing protein [Bacteroidetes bacterium]|nr:type IV toxin-antitoxin system AbiEi family antitoxin domain-containing protein [Bacteroidota bacterium]